MENLDPTLRLDLLALSEQTIYAGNNRNIFVSQADEVVIPKPGSSRCDRREAGRPGVPETYDSSAATDSAEVLWLCQFSGRAEKNLPEARGRCFRRG